MIVIKILIGLLAFGFLYWFVYYNWARKNQTKPIEPGTIVFFYDGDNRHMGMIIEYRHPVVKIRDFRTSKLTTSLTSEISITK